MDWISDPQAWVALLTLLALEIVLGIDNIIFISILVGRLPPEQRARGRTFGLALAMITRILLLLSITWVMGLSSALFEVWGQEISGRDLILLGGGLFLVGKAAHEMHAKLEGPDPQDVTQKPSSSSAGSVLAQILLLDIVFSLDSVITAVGMASQLWVMIAAMIVAVGVMLIFAGAIGDFVERHPTVKILALSFLLLIGVMLIAEGFGQHISKGYVYFAMAFALAVELLNLRLRKVQNAVQLRPGTERTAAARRSGTPA